MGRSAVLGTGRLEHRHAVMRRCAMAGKTYTDHFRPLLPDGPDGAVKRLTLARRIKAFELG